MKENKKESLFQKMFGFGGIGSGRFPLKSNIFGGKGFNKLGGSSSSSSAKRGQRKSSLLGNSSPSNLISGYYERQDELKEYQLLDITKLSINFFSDYITNYLESETQQVVTILDDQGQVDTNITDRINDILLGDLDIFSYIKDHEKDVIFYGQYGSLLCKSRDEEGHTRFRFEEILDPTTVITKRKKNKEGKIEESYLARGDDDKIYEISTNDCFVLGSKSLRLVNDLDDPGSSYFLNNNSSKTKIRKPSFGENKSKKESIDKIINKCSFRAGEPLFYSLILKLKELVIKEILVSLISLRDLSSTQIFLLQFDKAVPQETSNDICKRTTKLANNTNELATFLSSKFDAMSFIENTVNKSAVFVPDYNATVGGKNAMIPLDKLSDKLLDMMQTLDQCRANILTPLGIPGSILESSSGSKWNILQQSERANSRVLGFITDIKDSVTDLVQKIYTCLYPEQELDPSKIKLHITSKTSVEYNNQLNQSESISSLMNGVAGFLANSLQTLDQIYPLVDARSFINYLRNLIKDIGPDVGEVITDQSVEVYLNYFNAMQQAKAEQNGLDPSILAPPDEGGDGGDPDGPQQNV